MKKKTAFILVLTLVSVFLMVMLSGFSSYGGDFTISSSEQLNSQDYRIGVLSDSHSEYTDVLPSAQKISFVDSSVAAKAVKDHTIDCFITDKMTVEYLYGDNKDFDILYKGLGERHFSVAVSTRSKEFSAGLDKFITDCKTNGISEQMYSRWMDRNSEKPTFKEPAKPSDIIRVGVYSLAEPFQYHDAQNNLNGYNIELIKRYAASLNAGIDFREFDDINKMLAEVKKGYVDMVLSFDGALKGNDAFAFSKDYLVLSNSGIILTARSPYASIEQVLEYDDSFFGKVSGGFNYYFIRNGAYKNILYGLRNTLFITFVSAAVAWIFGVVLCIFKRCRIKWLNVLEKIFSTVITLIPLVILLMIFFYIFFARSGINIVWACSLAIGLYFSTAICKSLYEGIDQVDKRAVRALYALGYSRAKAYGRIIFPIGIKKSSERLLEQHINLFKATAIVGYFSVGDITYYVMNNFGKTDTGLIIATVVLAVIYAIIIGLMILAANFLQKRYRHKRRRKNFRTEETED